MTTISTLDECLSADSCSPGVAATISKIAAATVRLSERIGRGKLDGSLSQSIGTNVQGEVQQHLDVVAQEMILEALAHAPVAAVLSEESETPIIMDMTHGIAVAIDPLDGSSNIDTNSAIGTIFSLLPVPSTDPEEIFRQPGHMQLAAGYVIYGPQTHLVLTWGQGTQQFTLDRATGTYWLTGNLIIRETASEFAINMSNYRYWDPGFRRYIDDCLDGEEGGLRKNYNMRWLAALVGEAHRILHRGGVFMYPGDRRAGYREGRLRLIYEASPIAFITEQAGGTASDGATRIMDLVPVALHQRTGLVFGSAGEMKRLASYLGPGSEVRSPLFSRRGLFRN